MNVLSIDFETAGECNLLKQGAHKYAADLATQILMMGWAFDNEPPAIWLPGDPFPERVLCHVEQRGLIQAWNAQFERLIWWYILSPDFDIPEPTHEQWRCTAARARAHGLPGSLGDCARAMGLPMQKQAEGTRLIQTYSVTNTRWDDIPVADQELFVSYCIQDVEVERQIGLCLRDLDETEWAEYVLNERICDRGVPVDVPFAHAAKEYAEEVRGDVNLRIFKLTDGRVKNVTERKNRDVWLKGRLTPDQLDLLYVVRDDEKKFTFDQRHRNHLAECEDLDPDVDEFLDLVEEAGGATISKYKAMCEREMDGRLNGVLLFNGAGQTGRFASRGLQMHNLKRRRYDDPAPAPLIQAVLNGHEIPDVTHNLALLVRPSVHSKEGLTWCDWSAIEGRVAPWLANNELGGIKLGLYYGGIDPYVYNASATYGVPMNQVTKEQRQAGKLQELALQFLGGVGALKLMARNFGLKMSDDEAKTLRDGWRAANKWAMDFGDKLDLAVLGAVKNPRLEVPVGRVTYCYDGGDWLWCRLPSGRLISYFQPRTEMVPTPWGEERRAVTCLQGSVRPKVGEQWPRRSLRGGLLLENITQATAADLLRAALLRCAAMNLKVVLHVHDEIVCEGYCLTALRDCMLMEPSWTEGTLPLAVDGDTGTRYGK